MKSKVLLILCIVAVIAVIFYFLPKMRNMLSGSGQLEEIVATARTMSIQPNQLVTFKLQAGQLQPDPLGTIAIYKQPDGALTVALHKSGGQRAAHGYIYSDNKAVSESELKNLLSLHEELQVTSLSPGWWTYRSLEE